VQRSRKPVARLHDLTLKIEGKGQR